MTKYKLYYFPARGRAELIRMLFALAHVEYEDIRIEQDEWKDKKNDMPFGQLPVLEIDGNLRIAQSMAIARFLAREFKLDGETSVEKAKCDMIIDQIQDIALQYVPIFKENDSSKQDAMNEAFFKTELPTLLNYLENLLKSNKENEPYFLGKTLTWADIGLYVASEWLELLQPNAFEQFKLLSSLKNKVKELPEIKDWIEKRPVTIL